LHLEKGPQNYEDSLAEGLESEKTGGPSRSQSYPKMNEGIECWTRMGLVKMMVMMVVVLAVRMVMTVIMMIMVMVMMLITVVRMEMERVMVMVVVIDGDKDGELPHTFQRQKPWL
jgi:uncharacterized membrane protein YgcG